MKNSKIVSVVLLFVLFGCEANSIKNREAGALAGGALGAGLGAIVGHSVGSTGAGVAIGGGFGALSGGLIGNEMDNQNARQEETDQRLEDQDRQLEENRRLIQELRGRGADARITNRGVVVNLPDVLFDFGSASLTSSARGTVREISEAIEGVKGRHISVEGHTDSVGTAQYNQRLSESRARAVANALSDNGVPSRSMSVRGYGEGDPIASNNSDSGRQRNRRVEVIIENR